METTLVGASADRKNDPFKDKTSFWFSLHPSGGAAAKNEIFDLSGLETLLIGANFEVIVLVIG